MRRLSLVAPITLTLAFAGAGAAARQPTLFPLADGNRWTLRDVRSGTTRAISVDRRAGSFLLRGFPGLAPVRVRPAGSAVQAWDSDDRRWEPFLRLGARVGTKYVVDLSDTFLWRSVVVRVASKRVVVEDARGRVWRGCTRLELRYRRPIADAGLEHLSFAPRVGLVRFSETTIAGPRESALAAYSVRSR